MGLDRHIEKQNAKGMGNDMGMVENMGVISKGKEETWRENP